MTIADDLRRAFKAIEDEPRYGRTVTIHHPDCLAIKTGELRRCNCGGLMFPTRADTLAR